LKSELVQTKESEKTKNKGMGNDDFITAEYKKVRVRGEMSRYNCDTQKAGKTFKMN
jgi:hypothetical protein